MVKERKRYNWKSRQVVETTIDNSQTKKISLDIVGVRKENYDDCNALVIPSAKRKTKKKQEQVVPKKILSKKQRKKLEKIIEQKKKKENRSSLLKALAEVQANPEQLKRLTSITKCQTRGLKRIHEEERLPRCTESEKCVNSVLGSRKRRHLIQSEKASSCEVDPNVVGFESSSEDSEDSEGSVTPENEKETESNIETNDVETEENDNDDNLGEEDTKENVGNEISKDNKEIPSSEAVVLEEVKEELKEDVTSIPRKPAVFVPVNRPPSVQESRMKLPVLAEEQAIMEAINEHNVLVLAGETGSGKTTQLPQFLYEAGYARDGQIIGITEPRRVAAISMSKRVGYEMGLGEKEVSYLIRYEGNVTEDTKIKFMTDGVLLKEIQSDFILKKYSVIILDEAHERSVYTDILLGLLSRIVPLRVKRNLPLKLIVMSATLRIDDFVSNARLFPVPPPLIKVESRQFPVTVHFNKNTREDYVTEAYTKVAKIHMQLPDGSILVFLTGQQEVNSLVRKLRKAFPYKPFSNEDKSPNKKNKCVQEKKSKTQNVTTNSNDQEEDKNSEDEDLLHLSPKKKKKSEIPLPSIDLDEFPEVADNGESENLSDDECAEDIHQIIADPVATRQPLWVLPLFSLLPSYKQARVFEKPPEGCRLCVVATNVAETSLTIPNVRYVVDCGKEKVRRYDRVTGVSAFTVTWTSKASANQRAGRAGRTGPGHCYRLYSSAVFNDEFHEFSIPEIQRKPVDDLVLQMKAMGIHKVINFPFPSPPGLLQLQAAEKRLCLLGALQLPEDKKTEDWAARITILGQSMASFPVSPRFAKMLALSHQQGLLPYTICMVAALAVPEVLLERDQDKKLAQVRRSWAGVGNCLLLGDPIVLMRAVGAAEHAGVKQDLVTFCKQHGLRHKAVVEVRKLRLQLTAEINSAVPDINLLVDPNMPPPTDEQSRLLRQLLLSGLGDQVARIVDPDTLKVDEDKIKWKHAYKCGELEEPVRIHSTSVLRREYPEWVVYQEVFEKQDQRMYMRGVTAIEPEWLPVFFPALCRLTPPLPDPPPRYDATTDKIICHVTGTYGRAAWNLPVVEMDMPSGLDRYKWFAVYFLDGTVCPQLAKFRSLLLSSPSTMTKTWSRLQPRTEILLKAFVDCKIDSKSKLLEKWKNDRYYLLSAYQKWLPESACNEVVMFWPPV